MPIATSPDLGSRDAVSRLVRDLKTSWRDGESPDVAEAIREHPEMLAHRTLLVDLAYEAYCLQESAGCTPATEEFVQHLPAFQTHVREVILGHRELADHPEAFEIAPPEWPAEGQSLEGFTIVCELGRGAFARVYLGVDRNAGNRPVALKLSSRPSVEAHALGSIEHPHIARVLWAGRLGGFFAVCMPYVGSTTLADVIESRKLAPTNTVESADVIWRAIEQSFVVPPTGSSPEIVSRPVSSAKSYIAAISQIGAHLAESLAYLHGKRIVHGDLKPSNILLDRSGKPYLIDFNMARQDGDWRLRHGGTLPYMAPETITPASSEIDDPAADVYSLGVVLYQCLTGTLPHEPFGDDLGKIATDQLARKRLGCPPVRSRNSRVPRRVAAVLDRCLAPRPEHRPTAEAVAMGLRNAIRSSRLPGRLLGLATVTAMAIGVAQMPWFSTDHVPPAVRTEPVSLTQAAQFERAMDSLRKKDWQGARLDFDSLRQVTGEAKYFGYIAYCLTRAGQHRNAEGFYQLAIQNGFGAAWVHNNRAYSQMNFDLGPRQYQSARESARAAMSADPSSRTAKLNWAYATFLAHTGGKPRPFEDRDCIAALREVMASGPVDVDLAYKAAMVFAAAGEALHAEAVACLEKAIEYGSNPTRLRTDPAFVPFLDADTLRRLSNLPASDSPPVFLNLQVIEPPN